MVRPDRSIAGRLISARMTRCLKGDRRTRCTRNAGWALALVGDHVEMRVKSSPTGLPDSGFGMLKSRRAAVPADLDPATLIKR